MIAGFRVLAVLTAVLFAALAQQASAAQDVSDQIKRVFASENTSIDIDNHDDFRVDADIAILDASLGVHDPDLNVVGETGCLHPNPDDENYEAPDPEDPDWHEDPANPGRGCLDGGATPFGHFHGTFTAERAAAIDNDLGGVGVAPGARLWGVDVQRDAFFEWADFIDPSTGEQYEADLYPMIAGVKWVTSTRTDSDPNNDIEVVSMGWGCAIENDPVPNQVACPAADPDFAEALDQLEDAIADSVNEGVVYVAPAGNRDSEASNFIPAGFEDVIAVSSMTDTDGLPGGLGDPSTTLCGGSIYSGTLFDDSFHNGTNWGEGVDLAAPSGCTSGAAPLVTGAAALLASHDPPTSRADVEELRAQLIRTGDLNWIDDSGDTEQEPLVDVSCESVFAPTMVAGTDTGTLTAPGVPGAESDVDCDGRSDLVRMRGDGVVYVHPGGADSKFGSGVASFAGDPLDPAQYDGVGHYVVDVSDVDGDKRADLVTLDDDGDVHVYRGDYGLAFDEDGVVSELDLAPALLSPGGHEPIAVADVNGDSHGDLVSYDDEAEDVMVYLGNSGGGFGAGVTARSDVASALHGAAGHYFVDAGDVTGDGKADLVTISSTDDLNVFAGQNGGTFAAPIVSQKASINPAINDGGAYEPAGLGDVTGDGKADLVLLGSSSVYTYPALAGGDLGEFGERATSLAGLLNSSTFGAGPVEAFGVIDVGGDGRADLTGLNHNLGTIGTILGQANGTFTTMANTSGSFLSTQHSQNLNSSGSELVIQKPSIRRRGCPAQGCTPEGSAGDTTIGMFEPVIGSWNSGEGIWSLRDSNSTGAADYTLNYHWWTEGDIPISGDWDGDGDDAVSLYRRGVGTWNLRNDLAPGANNFVYTQSNPNEIPVVGDWDGDGDDTIGLYVPIVGSPGPGEGMWHLRNTNTAGSPDISFSYNWSNPNEIPIVGDWNGDGIDTIGMYQPVIGSWNEGEGIWYLRDSNSSGAADYTLDYHWWTEGDKPISGDWDGDGDDTVSLYRPSVQTWNLRNALAPGAKNFTYTTSNTNEIPIVGDWDGE